MLPVFSSLLTFFFVALCAANAQQNSGNSSSINPQEKFTSAVELISKGQNDQAQAVMSELLLENPNDSTLLYNAGLAAFSNTQLGQAAAYWRKAIFLNPTHFSAHEGLNQATEKIDTITNYHFLTPVYQRIPFTLLVVLCIALYLALAVSIVRLFKSRRQNEESSFMPVVVLSCVFVPLILLTALYSWQYLYTPKATILTHDTAVYARPDSEAPTLTTLAEGNEVLVLRWDDTNTWALVKKSATELGWVAQKGLFIHSGPLKVTTPTKTNK